MTVSKSQPMREAEIDAIDALNALSTEYDTHGEGVVTNIYSGIVSNDTRVEYRNGVAIVNVDFQLPTGNYPGGTELFSMTPAQQAPRNRYELLFNTNDKIVHHFRVSGANVLVVGQVFDLTRTTRFRGTITYVCNQ